MAVRTRIQPLEKTLRLMVDRALSPAAQSRAVAAYAREKLQEAQAQNRRVLGRIPAHRRFVDGSEGKALESVRPDGGRIVFTFEIAADLTGFILAELQRLSPVDSGDYKKSHMIFADGREVEAGAPLVGVDEVVFLNPLPYSRAIELGRMRMRVEGTSAVYQQATREAQRRFGNLASIKFSYRAPIGGAATGKAGRASRVPAIVVRMR
jgi:hypothetical protein